MFTGIVETLGRVLRVEDDQSNAIITVSSSISSQLQIDQSVAHDGVCLTVTNVTDNQHQVIAIQETLQKSNLVDLKADQLVNLERAVRVNTRLDGHIVQGHVDASITCLDKIDDNGSSRFQFDLPTQFAHLVIEKGSICLNGVSLTISALSHDTLEVAIIPYTLKHTTFQHIKPGDHVNVEFDMLGKYLARFKELGIM